MEDSAAQAGYSRRALTRARPDDPDRSRREGDLSRRSEASNFCDILADAPLGVAVVSARGKCLAANQAFASLLGCDPNEAQGRNVLEGDDGRLAVLLKVARRGGHGSIDGPAFAGRAGSWCVRARATPTGSVLLMLENRTEVDLATHAFHASERRFDLLMDSSSEGIVVHRQGAIFYANPAAVRMLGGGDMTDLAGRALDEFVEEAAMDSFGDWLRAASGPASASVSHRLRGLDGRFFVAEARALQAPVDDGPAGFLFLRDLTERSRLEAELARAQRLSSIGSRVGSVVHDFNNLLAGIQGSISLVEKQLESPADARRALNTARAAADQAGRLARDLLTSDGGESAEPARVCVFEVIGEVTELLRNMSGKRVDLSVAVADETMAARLPRSQLYQVLLNILTNGRDAVREQGKIHVSLRRSGTANKWIELTIIDDGPGMEAETRERLFEPFFTTKAPGEGTGLGLATVSTIVKQVGGLIEVESEPGNGSTFRVFLPNADLSTSATSPSRRRASESARTSPMARAVPVMAMNASPQTSAEGSPRGHVIVCDDDARLGTLTASLLESGGYRVEAHTDAAALLSGELGGAGVVLLDLHMGSQDILAVLDALVRRERPPAVVLTSGSSPEDIAEEIRNHSVVVDYLMKPYRPERLAACISKAVSGPGPERGSHQRVRVPIGDGGAPSDRNSESGTRHAFSTETRERSICRGDRGGRGRR